MLYIQIGQHKTGTTMIQQCCDMLDDKLQEQGLTYTSYLSYIGQLLQHNSPLDNKYIRELKRGFETVRTENMFISSEGFMGNPWEGYRNIEAVATDARKIFGEFQAICVIRPQDEWLESMYAQSIKEGSTWSFQEFINKVGCLELDWNQRLKSYPDCITLDYGKDIVHKVLDVMGVKLDLPEFYANFSLNRNGIELAKMVNPYLNPEQIEEFRSFLERCFIKPPGQPFNFFDDETRKQLKAHYEQN